MILLLRKLGICCFFLGCLIWTKAFLISRHCRSEHHQPISQFRVVSRTCREFSGHHFKGKSSGAIDFSIFVFGLQGVAFTKYCSREELPFVLAPASPASLLLLRGPESENNLPEIWRGEKEPLDMIMNSIYIKQRGRDTFCYKFSITIFTFRNFPSSTNFLRGACMIEFTVDLEQLSAPSEFRLDPFCCVFLHNGGGAMADNCKF